MALHIYKTGEDLGCRNHILILDVFCTQENEKMPCSQLKKLKPNRERGGGRETGTMTSRNPSRPPATCDPVHAVDGMRSSEVCEREVDPPPPPPPPPHWNQRF